MGTVFKGLRIGSTLDLDISSQQSDLNSDVLSPCIRDLDVLGKMDIFQWLGKRQSGPSISRRNSRNGPLFRQSVVKVMNRDDDIFTSNPVDRLFQHD